MSDLVWRGIPRAWIFWRVPGLLLLMLALGCGTSAPETRATSTGENPSSGVVQDLPTGDVAEGNGDRVATVGPAIRALAISPDGARLAIGDEGGVVTLVDLPERARLWSTRLHEGGCLDLAFTPAGQIVSGGADSRVLVLAAGDAAVLQTHSEHRGAVRSVCIPANGSFLLTGGEDGQLLMKSLQDGSLTSLGAKREGVTSLALSRDGKWAVSCREDQSLELWDLTTKTAVTNQGDLPGDVLSASFSPKGESLVAVGADQRVKVWRRDAPGEKILVTGPLKGVTTALFTLDGEHVITAGEQGEVSMIRSSDGMTNSQVLLPNPVSKLTLSPDGSLLAVGTTGGQVVLLRVGAELNDLGVIYQSEKSHDEEPVPGGLDWSSSGAGR